MRARSGLTAERLLVAGAIAAAVSLAGSMVSTGVSGRPDQVWLAFGFCAWALAGSSALLVRSATYDRPTRLLFVLDAILMALAVFFACWDLVIAPGHDPALGRAWPRAIAYPLAGIVASVSYVLASLVSRTPRTLLLLAASVLATAGEVVLAAASVHHHAPPRLVGNLWWATWVALFVLGLVQPDRRSGDRAHLTFGRQLLVHLPVTGALWLCTWEFVARDRPPSAPAAVIGIAFGLLFTARELASWTQARALTQSLASQAGELGRTKDDLLVLLDEQRCTADRLAWAASHDGLTGLPNRYRFVEHLEQDLRRCPPGTLATVFIDLDDFKMVNDSLGHAAGDRLLQAVGDRLRTAERDGDVLSRFGGDEFVLLVNGLGVGYEPLDVVERLRDTLVDPIAIEGFEVYVTASVGITVADREGLTASDLLRDADAAMYRAKGRGPGNVEVLAADHPRPSQADALLTSSQVRRGLGREEFEPYFQPIVDAHDGRLCGFEALARWHHPGRGLLSPAAFLPGAEHSGQIGDLGGRMLRASLDQLGRWRAERADFDHVTIAVNASTVQLVDERFPAEVAAALAASGVPAHLLWLEITETVLMSDTELALDTVRRLRALGVNLAVDDFGTGYASLTYLRHLPLQGVKVDQSFVASIATSEQDATIVGGVIQLSHGLGLTVVAEGVETTAQLERLRALGCDRVQGYLFGRPAPAADVLGTLQHDLVRADRASATAE